MQRELSGVVDEVVRHLRDSISVNLVGLRQAGRSLIAQLAADELRDAGLSVVSIAGIAAFGDRPLAALALAGVDVPSGAPAASISGAAEALRKSLRSTRSVLIVDDADDLDPDSAGVVAAVRATQPFPVLSITRFGARGGVIGHWRTADFQPGLRIVLDPLTFDQVNRVVHRALPGPVDAALVGRIATLSGGLYGLVSAIAYSGRRTGVIVEEGGVWTARAGLWTTALTLAVDPLLADLTDEDVDALTRLSAVGIVPLTAAQQIVADQQFVRLNSMGLLQVAQGDPDPVAGVYPPLLAEYLLRTGAVASLLDSAEPPGAEPSAARAHLSRVALVGPRRAVLNTQMVEYTRQEVAARRAAWLEDPSVGRAVDLLFALDENGADSSAFEAVFDGTQVQGADSTDSARFVAWRAAHSALVLGDLAGAQDLLAAQRVADPAMASWLRAREANLQLFAGRLPDAEMLASAGPDGDPEGDIEGEEALETVRILTLLAQGMTIDALDAASERAASATGQTQDLQVAIGLGRVLHGSFDAGVEWALQALGKAEARRRISDIHAHAYVAALGLAFAGRLDELDALVGRVLTLSSTTVFSGQFRAGILGLAALSAGWRGQANYLWALSVQAEAAGRRQGPFPGMTHGITPLVAELQSNVEQAGRRLWRAVSERLDQGFLAAGVALAVTAVEAWPDVESAVVAAEHARRTQSPFMITLGHYITATATGDPDALSQCIVDLSAHGADVHALKAAVTRALLLRLRGDIEASVAQAEQAWDRSAKMGEPLRGLFLRLGHAAGLTAREREIAQMVTEGMGTRAIASALALSSRTVENYLFAAYRKLGSEGRDDMVRAVSTWAALG